MTDRPGGPSRRSFVRTAATFLVSSAYGAKFTDIAARAGLGSARNTSGAAENKQYLLEEMGGGVALFDYDNDGWLDIFLVYDTAPGLLARNRGPASKRVHLSRGRSLEKDT